MSEAPVEVWVRWTVGGHLYGTGLHDEPSAVRYVRADLYEALQARMAVVRSWNEAPCLEPLGSDALRSVAGAMQAGLKSTPKVDEVIEYLDRHGELIPEGELLPDLSNAVAFCRMRLVRVR